MSIDIHVHVKKSLNIAEIDIEKKMLWHKKKVMRGVIENRKLIPAMSFLQKFYRKNHYKVPKKEMLPILPEMLMKVPKTTACWCTHLC